MESNFNNSFLFGLILIFLVGLFVFQLVVLWRIRKILQQIFFYIESISKFLYKLSITSKIKPRSDAIPHTCQYCKYRLSFIHMSENEGEVEDFYYKCRLRNIEILLEDTCEQYKSDPNI
jgi:hypothetical protein